MDNLFARLFGPSKRFAIPLNADPIGEYLSKRLTPEQLASIQSEMSVSAMRASSTAAAGQRPTPSTTRPGANAATSGTSIASNVSTFSVAPSFTVGDPIAQTPSSSSSTSSVRPTSTSATSLSTSAPPSISSVISTTTSPTSTVPPTSLPAVVTRTISASSSSSSASLPTISADAATAGTSSSTGLSTGAVVGIVLAVLVGVVILGSMLGWLYRKFTTRSYEAKSSSWRKLEEDVTPFPMEKDEHYQDDIYGGAAAPVIGSRRQLADRADAYARPDSTYMFDRGNNRAGLGAGTNLDPGYPVPSGTAVYGVDAQGRPYNGQAGRVPVHPHYHQQQQQQQHYPQSQAYRDEYEYGSEGQQSPPGGARQLVGSGPDLSPVALGRPAPPRSYSDIASREDYADEPLSAGLAYAEPYAPAGYSASSPPSTQRSPPQHPQAYQQSRRISGGSPPMGNASSPPRQAPMPLPSFTPLSPLSSSFDLHGKSQPLAMYQPEAETGRQKQLYGEVSQAAGFPEPNTPHSATMTSNLPRSTGTNPDNSFASVSTTSSFSATEHGMRLPAPPRIEVPPIPLSLSNPNPNPPGPYEHGRPLSPLTELPTPSTVSTMPIPMPSASIGHGLPPYQNSGGVLRSMESNPFDRLPAPLTPAAPGSQTRNLTAPPMSAATWSTGSSGIPSARYPPPSPGGMSVPGSVTDSPRRWNGERDSGNAGMVRRSRGESMFDEEDAYGGI